MKKLKYGFWFIEFCQALIEDEHEYADIILRREFSEQQIIDHSPAAHFNRFPFNILLDVCQLFWLSARYLDRFKK